jgi:transposase-like protein
MTFSRKELIKSFIKDNDLKTATDVQEVLKELFAETLQGMLEAEMDNHLGYSKYDYKNKSTTNSRNGKAKKKVTSNLGEFELEVPRDRESEFEPQIVKKRQTDISSIEDQVISMYARGMSTRDIGDHMSEIYGIEASPTLISNITDKILPLIQEWQNRPLESIYPIIFLDAIHYKVRQDAKVVSKAAYIIIGVNMQGFKDVLGIWVGENESAKYWLTVSNELRNRGVKDILIASIDGLTGFKDAIRAVFPEAEIQRCIVHQIRNSTRYVSYKHLKEFTRDLKTIYTAVNENEALKELDNLDNKWGEQYAIAIKSWRNNWDELSTFFKYPQEIRTLIYTTNAIESYNRQLRKVTKAKTIFPTDESLIKMLYLATMDITKKWTQVLRNWPIVLAQLSIYFDDRIDQSLF